jgi:hypothetical protein
MWAYIKPLFAGSFELKPPPVTIVGARFPADGSPPHLVSLTTTSGGVNDGYDSFLFHIPDLREDSQQRGEIESFRD